MGKILQILFLILAVSTLLSAVLFFLEYSDHYLNLSKVEHQNDNIRPITLDGYKISTSLSSDVTDYKKPILPDIENYSADIIIKTMPDVTGGEIELQNLENAYPKVRSKIAFYGDLQGRLTPKAITVKSGIVNLQQISEAISDKDMISVNMDGGFILKVPLIIKPSATLIMNDGETLLMSATQGALIAILGTVNIVSSHILGWDTVQDQPSYFEKDKNFRPYIVAWCGSRLNIMNSYLGYLGYDAAKSYGLTYSSCENDKYVEKGTPLKSGTGWILNNEFENLYFGFYSYETEDAVLIGNTYKDNIVYGIDPHDRSKNLIIANNNIKNTRRKHGIILSRDVHESYVVNNVTENNRGTGIMLDRNSHNNVIAYNISQYNGHDGLSFYESPSNITYKNILYANGKSGLRVRNSWSINSIEDVINDNKTYAVELYAQTLKTRAVNDKKDPYQLTAGILILKSEIIGNELGVFRLDDFNSFGLHDSNIYEVKGDLFSTPIKKIKNYNFLSSKDLLIERQQRQN